MRVRFTRDHDHVEVMQTLAFKAGGEHIVRREIGEAAVAAGAAEAVVADKEGDASSGEDHGGA